MIWSKSVRTWHRWLSVIVGLQLLAWTVSGFMMTWNDIEEVRGNLLMTEPTKALPGDHAPTPPAMHPAGTTELRYVWRRGQWIWRALDGEGETLAVFDGATGQPLPDLTSDEATALAAEVFTGEGNPVAAELVTDASGEYRGNPVPAWRVTFDDAEDCNLYLDARTGSVTKVRTDIWRRFDFFWMLHIMDYEERTDFHHPVLRIAAGLGVATSITGLWLAVLILLSRKIRTPR